MKILFLTMTAMMAAATAAGQLVMPEMPVNLTTPQQRADYLVAHYWDNVTPDIAADQLEQAAVDYITIFPVADSAAVSAALAALADRAATYAPALLEQAAQLGAKYLGEKESPMYAPVYYDMLLRAVTRHAGMLSLSTRELALYDYEMNRRNMPGRKVPDFALTDEQGRATTLYEAAGGKEVTLIIYDPDCDACRELLATLPPPPHPNIITVVGNEQLDDIFDLRDLPLTLHLTDLVIK